MIGYLKVVNKGIVPNNPLQAKKKLQKSGIKSTSCDSTFKRSFDDRRLTTSTSRMNTNSTNFRNNYIDSKGSSNDKDLGGVIVIKPKKIDSPEELHFLQVRFFQENKSLSRKFDY
jgi:hypothetical protein